MWQSYEVIINEKQVKKNDLALFCCIVIIPLAYMTDISLVTVFEFTLLLQFLVQNIPG